MEKYFPVGGIKEKVLAAKRAGIRTIILCKENEKDVSEIKESYVKDLEFLYVDKMSQVIQHALEEKPVKNAKRLLPKKKESEKAAEKDLNRIEQIRKIVAQA